MEGACMRCAKCLMIFINTLILCFGIGFLGIGVWLHIDTTSFRQLVSSNPVFSNSILAFIVIGSVLILSGFCGCAGAIRESRCLLGTYFTIILILVIVEVAVSVFMVVYFTPATFKAALLKSMQSNETAERTAWNVVQTSLKCCGLSNATDWKNNIPASCCSDMKSSCTDTSSSIYKKGCEKAFYLYFWIIGGIVLGIVLFEVFAMIFSCCLYKGSTPYHVA